MSQTSNVLLVKKVLTTTPEGTPLMDKNEREYKRIEVSTMPYRFVDLGDGKATKVRQEVKSGIVNAWKEQYSNNKEQYGYDFKEGEVVMGDIVQREVVPYNIPSRDGELREVNQYSTVVFGDTTDKNWENKVKAAFKAAGHPVVEEQPAFAAPLAVSEEAAF